MVNGLGRDGLVGRVRVGLGGFEVRIRVGLFGFGLGGFGRQGLVGRIKAVLGRGGVEGVGRHGKGWG